MFAPECHSNEPARIYANASRPFEAAEQAAGHVTLHQSRWQTSENMIFCGCKMIRHSVSNGIGLCCHVTQRAAARSQPMTKDEVENGGADEKWENALRIGWKEIFWLLLWAQWSLTCPGLFSLFALLLLIFLWAARQRRQAALGHCSASGGCSRKLVSKCVKYELIGLDSSRNDSARLKYSNEFEFQLFF